MDGFKEFINHDYSDQEVIHLYLGNSHKRLAEIAGITGKSVAEIYRILHGNGVAPNRLRVNHHLVADFADAGLGIPQIAELTGYTPRNVRYILQKRS